MDSTEKMIGRRRLCCLMGRALGSTLAYRRGDLNRVVSEAHADLVNKSGRPYELSMWDIERGHSRQSLRPLIQAFEGGLVGKAQFPASDSVRSRPALGPNGVERSAGCPRSSALARGGLVAQLTGPQGPPGRGATVIELRSEARLIVPCQPRLRRVFTREERPCDVGRLLF